MTDQPQETAARVSGYILDFDYRSDNGPHIVGPFFTREQAFDYAESLHLDEASYRCSDSRDRTAQMEPVMPDGTAVPVLSPAELAEMKELAALATGGPWVLDRHDPHMDGRSTYYVRKDGLPGVKVTLIANEADAAFIVAARAATPRLIAALSAALDENQRLRARVEAVEALISEELRNYGEAGAVAVIALRSVLSAEEASDE